MAGNIRSGGSRLCRALLLVLAAALAGAGCAEREHLEALGKADLRLVGEPIMFSLPHGPYVIWTSFGGAEFVLVDPSLNYDQAYIDSLCANSIFKICRYADCLWRGLVRNHGDTVAEEVYVRIEFAGGWVDSAYVDAPTVRPNETVNWQLYSRGRRVERAEVLWREPEAGE